MTKASTRGECFQLRDTGKCTYDNCRFEPCYSNKQKKRTTPSKKCIHCGGAHNYKRCADLAKIFQETSSLGAFVAQEEGGAGEGA